MKSTGILRKIDEMGRFVLPKEIRMQLNIRETIDSIEIFVNGKDIILRKHEETCNFCGEKKNLKTFKGFNVCEACIKELKENF